MDYEEFGRKLVPLKVNHCSRLKKPKIQPKNWNFIVEMFKKNQYNRREPW